jgi:hypothetical protein
MRDEWNKKIYINPGAFQLPASRTDWTAVGTEPATQHVTKGCVTGFFSAQTDDINANDAGHACTFAQS